MKEIIKELKKRMGKALRAFESGDFSEAIEIYNSPGLVEHFPEALLGLGAALDAEGKFLEAVRATRDFIARIATLPKDAYQRDDLPKAHTNLACSLYSLGRSREARLEVTRALELNPSDKDAQTLLRTIDEARETLSADDVEFEREVETFESIVCAHKPNPFTAKRAVSEFANYLRGRTLSNQQRENILEICRVAGRPHRIACENIKGESDSENIEGVNCDEIITALEGNAPFFISSLGIVLDFGDDLDEIDEQFVYTYFLNKILFAPKALFSVVSIEDDGRTIDYSELKTALIKSRKLSEFAEASSLGNLDRLLNDSSKLPWEHFRVLARLPMKYGKSAFVFFSGSDMDKNLMIDAYCVKESVEEELGNDLVKLFGASGFTLHGGSRTGNNPISTDNEAIEKLTLSIDSETHLHPDD